MQEIKLLEVGDDSPVFTYKDAKGVEYRSDELLGSYYIVYFYPKDNTPGCNKEACGFRDRYADLQNLGLTVIGVSCDDEKSHQKFRDKFNLPFAMVADTDQKMVKEFGVWGKKSFMGKAYEGIHRVSYLIDPQGQICKVYPKVKPEVHASEVQQDLLDILRNEAS
jgi:peroxiredoxin Q/BCP